MNTVKDYVNLRLTHADKVSEAQGCPLELYDCKKYKPMKDLKIYGESVQDGTPSPQMPIEVQSVGEKSVNLVKDVREIYKKAYLYEEITEDNRECIRFSSANTINYTSIEFKENTQYTFSFDCKCVKREGQSAYPPYDYALTIFYTDGTRSVATSCDADVFNTWIHRVLTSTANKTISSIGLYSHQYAVYNYIDINTFQIEEGTKATEYRPYGKYKIPVTISGKNLASAYDVCKNFAAYEESITLDGRQCVRYQSNGGGTYTDYPFKEKTQYTVSFYVKSVRWEALAGANCILRFVYTDGSVGNANNKDAIYVTDTTEWNKVVVTSREGKTVKGFGVDGNHYALRHHIDVNTFQFEEGAVATEYDAYVDPVTTNIYLDEPLRKIGNYADYMDFKNNKVVRNVDRKLIEYTDRWYWNVNVDSEDMLSVYRGGYFDSIYKPAYQIISSHFPYMLWGDIKGDTNLVWCAYVSGGFKISTDLIDGYDYSWSNQQKIEAFLKWAQSIGLEWYLARKTPREEALNIDIPKLKSKTTIIEVGTSLAPSNVFGKYIKK